MTLDRVPDWWEFALLALAAFRVYRLIARDTITEPVRAAVTYPDDEAIALSDEPTAWEHNQRVMKVIGDDEQPKTWRIYLSTLLRCPWCAGFYVSVAAWGLWVAWPTATLFVAAPLAVSAVVALLEKNLDA